MMRAKEKRPQEISIFLHIYSTTLLHLFFSFICAPFTFSNSSCFAFLFFPYLLHSANITLCSLTSLFPFLSSPSFFGVNEFIVINRFHRQIHKGVNNARPNSNCTFAPLQGCTGTGAAVLLGQSGSTHNPGEGGVLKKWVKDAGSSPFTHSQDLFGNMLISKIQKLHLNCIRYNAKK